MSELANTSLLGQEWVTLQNNVEQYERSALIIKLAAIGLTAAGLLMGLNTMILCALLLVLWLQEGIWRTFQARLGQRILHLEARLRPSPSGQIPAPLPAPFQLHSEWLASRSAGPGLMHEYLSQALRPTVAYPYAVLILGVLGVALFQGTD